MLQVGFQWVKIEDNELIFCYKLLKLNLHLAIVMLMILSLFVSFDQELNYIVKYHIPQNGFEKYVQVQIFILNTILKSVPLGILYVLLQKKLFSKHYYFTPRIKFLGNNNFKVFLRIHSLLYYTIFYAICTYVIKLEYEYRGAKKNKPRNLRIGCFMMFGCSSLSFRKLCHQLGI